MRYMLLLNELDSEFVKRGHPGHAGPYWAGWNAFIGAMTKAGIVVRGDGLESPQTATTVRVREGKRLVQDGPFADAKEQLGGYVVIEVPDLDTALKRAAKAPSASYASVEIRPVLPPMAPPAA